MLHSFCSLLPPSARRTARRADPAPHNAPPPPSKFSLDDRQLIAGLAFGGLYGGSVYLINNGKADSGFMLGFASSMMLVRAVNACPPPLVCAPMWCRACRCAQVCARLEGREAKESPARPFPSMLRAPSSSRLTAGVSLSAHTRTDRHDGPALPHLSQADAGGRHGGRGCAGACCCWLGLREARATHEPLLPTP